jgi:lipopolysaccharide transport system ATP-binding protein
MSDIAIHAEHLSKRYRLGEREPYKSLRDVIVRTASAPVRWVRQRGQPEAGNWRGYFWALDDISFEIKQGEVVGIIGRNGAGKSTLLKILSRITKPTRGFAEIHGRVGSLLEVGTGFHPELTGRENIYLNGAILGMKRAEIERKFDEIVDFAEIEKFLDTPVKRYSSGMYVRLAFSVAAHLEPEILLVDEVLAVGDAAFQKKSLGKMEEISGTGRTVLFVSHNMGAIEELCRFAILLDKGSIVTTGPARQVVSIYLQSVDFQQNVRQWDLDQAPGQEKLKLLSIKILDQSGQPRQLFRSDEPIQVELTYKVKAFMNNARIGIRVLGANNTVLFASTDSDDEIGESHKDLGVYKSCCLIPQNLLNSGSYKISVAGDIPMREVLILTEPLVSFELELAGGVSTRHSDQRPGFFRPRLEWKVERLS